MKLELGAGHRPTRGYEHNDLHPFDHIEHPGVPWLIDLPDRSLEEVLALAFIEHLTYSQAMDTFRNVHRMLHHAGLFFFDVPEYPIWCQYYLDNLNNRSCPLPQEHVLKTLFGWQRWPGDEHKWGWDRKSLTAALTEVGFNVVSLDDVQPFAERAYRNRFHNSADAHLYVIATK